MIDTQLKEHKNLNQDSNIIKILIYYIKYIYIFKIKMYKSLLVQLINFRNRHDL